MESANSGLGEGEPYSIGTCDIVDLLIKKGSHCEMQGNLEMAANFYHTAFDKRPDIETAKILYGTLISFLKIQRYFLKMLLKNEFLQNFVFFKRELKN